MKAWLQEVTFLLTVQLTLIIVGFEASVLLLCSVVKGCFSVNLLSLPVVCAILADACVAYVSVKVILRGVLRKYEDQEK